MKLRNFALGCLIGLALFIAINLIAAHLLSDCGLPAVFGRDFCADDIARAGWPFVFWEEGGFAFRSIFNQGALITDAIVGITIAVLTGLTTNMLAPKAKPTDVL